jgi:predicted ATPase
VRLLLSAEGTPFELFARIISPQEAQQSAASTHAPSVGASSSAQAQQRHMHLQHAGGSGSGTAAAQGAGPDVVVDAQLSFAKERAISRLTEMQSVEYLLAHAQQHAPHLVLALQEMAAKSRQQQPQHQPSHAQYA